jgi:hypothetical protein
MSLSEYAQANTSRIRGVMGDKKVWLGILLVLVAVPDIQIPYSWIGHVPLFYVWAAFISGYFIWKNPRTRLPVSTKIFLILLAVMIISVLFGVPKIILPTNLDYELDYRFTPLRAVLHIGWWILGFSVVYAVTNLVTIPDRIRMVASYTIFIAGIVVLVALYELLARWQGLPYIFISTVAWDTEKQALAFVDLNRILRPSGTFREPKLFGQFLLLPMLFTFAYAIAMNNKKWLVPGLLFAVLIGWSGSTPAIIGAIASSLIVAVVSLKYGFSQIRVSRRQLAIGTIVTVILAIAVIPQIYPFAQFHILRIETAWTSFVQTDTTIVPGRLLRDSIGGKTVSTDYIYGWKRGVQIFLDNPILGVGLSYSPFHMGVWDRVITPFSLYFMLLAEIGIIGFGLFLAFLFQIVKTGVASIRSLERKFGRFESLAAAALVGALIGDLFTYQSTGGARFEAHDWLIIGLIAALPRLRRSDESEIA